METIGIFAMLIPIPTVALALTGWFTHVELPRDFLRTLPFAVAGALVVRLVRQRRSN